jgi:hypothetical protein
MAGLLSAAAVRERCALVLAAAERGRTRHFRLAPERLGAIAGRIAAVTRRRFPDLRVPYHSRWRHFAAGGIDRAALVAPGADDEAKARARLDLAIVSVLLDTGAGPAWRYREAETGLVLSRSEGLGVASLRAMQRGLFSADPDDPWRADAAALARLDEARLAAAFQSGPGNPLVGIAGRVALMHRLARSGLARPSDLYAPWRAQGAVAAPEILRSLLAAFGLRDWGTHGAVPGDGIVPFHKLSQWLAYSLVEPLLWAGHRVTELDRLTGLAEYRNGGLLLDGGALVPCDPGLPRRRLDPQEEAVVEWRALTVALLDRLHPLVCAELGLSAGEFPLACMLEGGSWAAGRELAAECRPGGGPPLAIASDGTLF